MNRVPIDLLEVEVLRGRIVAWNITPLPPLSSGSNFWLLLPLLLRSAGLCSRRGSGVVSARYFPFPITSRAQPCLLPLSGPEPPLSLPLPRIPFECSLRCLLLFPSGLERNIGTLPQTPAGHADAIRLAELALRGLACRYGTAFATGVDGRTIRSCWCHNVSRRRRPLLLPPSIELDLD